MMERTYIWYLIAALLVSTSACKKEFDVPPVKQISDGARITIATIKTRYDPQSMYRFKGDTNLYCVVVADEVSGNLYKEVYVKDGTGGLHIKLTEAGVLFTGDSIRINLRDVVLNNYSELVQLDSVDAAKNIVKLASGLNVQPQEATIGQLTENPGVKNTFQSALVRLTGVEFLPANRDLPYANVNTKAAIQHTLQDCQGNTVLLRTSGYSYFASRHTPSGNGILIAIAGQFNNSVQLILRNADEVLMNDPVCALTTPTVAPKTSYLLKNFEDGSISSGNWSNVNVTGTVNWSVKTVTASPAKVAECNNFISPGNQPLCETWLISPPIDLSQASVPGFSFTSAGLFTGPPLQALISTDYTSGLPALSTWTLLAPTFATGNQHTASGIVDLSVYKTTHVRLAFKYTGNSGSGQRWQVDNIRVGE